MGQVIHGSVRSVQAVLVGAIVIIRDTAFLAYGTDVLTA